MLRCGNGVMMEFFDVLGTPQIVTNLESSLIMAGLMKKLKNFHDPFYFIFPFFP
jgi:hypothetical protein